MGVLVCISLIYMMVAGVFLGGMAVFRTVGMPISDQDYLLCFVWPYLIWILRQKPNEGR